uniref:Gag-pol n=1 Tax=Oryza sativa subsp. japonica TaxID=39947 RepID=Q93Y69_ORYSJ|nr:putative gag-pol precursor [Oryza sativa Japonica Group]
MTVLLLYNKETSVAVIFCLPVIPALFPGTDGSGTQQRIVGNLSPYTTQESHHADAKYYFPVDDSDQTLGRTTPAADLLIAPGRTPTPEIRRLITAGPLAGATGSSTRNRRNNARHHSFMSAQYENKPYTGAGMSGVVVPVEKDTALTSPTFTPLLLKAGTSSRTPTTQTSVARVPVDLQAPSSKEILLTRNVAMVQGRKLLDISNDAPTVITIRARNNSRRSGYHYEGRCQINSFIGKGWDQRSTKQANAAATGYIYASMITEQEGELEDPFMLDELKEEKQPTIDDLVEINLGTMDDPRPTFVSAALSAEEQESYRSFLMEYRDCFAWTYKEMPGLDPRVATHKLAIDPQFRPVKQPPRRLRPEFQDQVIAEVDRLITAGFIKEVQYPRWLANIVPDDFPIPITEMVVDSTTGYGALSFMDGSSGYNQIKMDPRDAIDTAFRTPKGNFYYTTKERKRHQEDLRVVFERLRKHQHKMNPLKCAFAVQSGIFLGFVVRYRGIEIEPKKIKAIVNMPPPKNLKDLKTLQGKLAYIRRFISNISGRIQPFAKLMKKGAPFEWDAECQSGFDSIKRYLLNLPILAAPVKGRPLILYIATQPVSVGALLAQHNDEGKEVACYYLSRTMVGAERNYSPIEKLCLALIFALKKLRHYMLTHQIQLIATVDPIRYVLSQPLLAGRLGKWALLMMEFDITYVPQKAVKGQALAEFLAAHPVPDDSPLITELPDEDVFTIETEPSWELCFDGASRTENDRDGTPRKRAGAGLVFKTPQGGVIYHSFSLLKEECSNNEAEYEALIFGLLLALSMEVRSIRVYGDSQLIVQQINDIYEVLKQELVPYYSAARRLMEMFGHIEVMHVPRSRNAPADALAKLAAALVLPQGGPTQVNVEERWLLPAVLELLPNEYEVDTVMAAAAKEDDWRVPFLNYFRHGSLPDNSVERRQLQRRLPSYVYKSGVSYRRSYGQEVLLRCVDRLEADKALQEVHHGVCGGHQSGPKMYHSIRLAGYYWPEIMADCLKVAKSCHGCQIHGDFKHLPPVPLHPTVPAWPFEAWGIDVIGPIDPPSSRGHRFIFAITDYFSKWAEAVSLREVKTDNVISFLERHIIYRFGVPHRISSDNGKAFKSHKMQRFIAKYKIRWNYSTGYYPQANGMIEAFNKTLGKILKKVVNRHRRDWHDHLFEALWAYRVTVRTPTQCTPYSLVYGSEAVLPLEVEVPSLRVAIHEEITQDEQVRLRFQELDTLEEGRLQAVQNLELYRQNMVRAYNKLVK